ncbi:MAG: hypothetical protein D6782_03595 [Alphaproteobacteria bacterium]|nr:MAG: hypothetical protein D6782_03595 [Alphaproteobacteria bacterium]
MCHGFAAAIGLNMTRQAPQQIGRCVLVDAYWPLDAAMREKLAKRHFPDRSPNAHGGHLLAAWRFLRGRALFWPWFDERRTTIIPTQESALEPNALQHALIGFFEAPPWAEGLLRACLDTDLAAAGTDLAERIGWLCPDWTIARTELWRPDATRHGAVAGYDNRDMAARNQALRQLLDSGNQ